MYFKQKTANERRISDWSTDVCSSDLITNLRRAIIATGLVSDVDITPVRGAALADGSVLADLDVRMKAAPMRTIAGSAGYDTGQGVRAEISWQHRNLIRPEGAVTFRAIARTQENGRAACRENVCQDGWNSVVGEP